MNNPLHDIQIIEKTLLDNFTLYYMEDGTVDMGSSFDIFDEVSHYDNPYIFEEHKEKREYLKRVMELAGFVAYDKEWWHFRLMNDPFPGEYFDFDMYELSNHAFLMGPGTLLISTFISFFVLNNVMRQLLSK